MAAAKTNWAKSAKQSEEETRRGTRASAVTGESTAMPTSGNTGGEPTWGSTGDRPEPGTSRGRGSRTRRS
jgi:hypothetical protein